MILEFLSQKFPNVQETTLAGWHRWILSNLGEKGLIDLVKNLADMPGENAFIPSLHVFKNRQRNTGPQLNSDDYVDRVQGMVVGMAVGDSLGYRDEFHEPEEIINHYGLLGVTNPQVINRRGEYLYTDDTQMALALAEGLLNRSDESSYDTVVRAFVDWMRSPDNNRAPGFACMSGCSNLESGIEWHKAAIPDSKGAGSVMRVFPVGALYRDNINALVVVSADQSVMTHAHPTGIIASIITAYATALILKDTPPDATLIDACIARNQEFPNNFEMERALTSLKECIDRNLDAYKASELLGSGWVGEEAFAIGMWAFLQSPEDYPAVIWRSVNFPGRNGSCDRDTVGAIAGAFAGAYNGLGGILPHWQEHIENRQKLLEMGEQLAKHAEEFCQRTVDLTQSRGLELLARPYFGWQK